MDNNRTRLSIRRKLEHGRKDGVQETGDIGDVKGLHSMVRLLDDSALLQRGPVTTPSEKKQDLRGCRRQREPILAGRDQIR